MGSSAADEKIGRAVTVARGARSQQQVADEMRRRGHRWSQATVWAVEKGERPLRLTEAADLAVILRTTVEAFVGAGSTIEDRTARGLVVELARAIDDLTQRTGRIVDARAALKGYLAQFADRDVQKPSQEILDAAWEVLQVAKPDGLADRVRAVMEKREQKLGVDPEAT